MIHTYSYEIGVFKFILLVRIEDNLPIKLGMVGNNTGTYW